MNRALNAPTQSTLDTSFNKTHAGYVGAQPIRGVLEGCPLEINRFIKPGAHKPNRRGGRRSRSFDAPA
jgi:hypothetical protein